MLKDPFIISSIIITISFLVILITNLYIKNKIIQVLFIIFSSIFISLILLFDNNFIYDFINVIITYIWYPNYLIFVLIVLTSIFIFLYTLFRKKMLYFQKIINYLLFLFNFMVYIIFLRLDINNSLYSSLYQKKSLILTRSVTIIFLIWLIVSIIYKFVKRGKYEK